MRAQSFRPSAGRSSNDICSVWHQLKVECSSQRRCHKTLGVMKRSRRTHEVPGHTKTCKWCAYITYTIHTRDKVWLTPRAPKGAHHTPASNPHYIQYRRLYQMIILWWQFQAHKHRRTHTQVISITRHRVVILYIVCIHTCICMHMSYGVRHGWNVSLLN